MSTTSTKWIIKVLLLKVGFQANYINYFLVIFSRVLNKNVHVYHANIYKDSHLVNIHSYTNCMLRKIRKFYYIFFWFFQDFKKDLAAWKKNPNKFHAYKSHFQISDLRCSENLTLPVTCQYKIFCRRNFLILCRVRIWWYPGVIIRVPITTM